MTTKKLRSQEWFGRKDRDGFIYRSWMKNQGWPHDMFTGRPVIGICNSWSELTPCNAHFREIAEWVKRGVWEAGGLLVLRPRLHRGRRTAASTLGEAASPVFCQHFHTYATVVALLVASVARNLLLLTRDEHHPQM